MKDVTVTATVNDVDLKTKVTSEDGLVQFALNVGNPTNDVEVLV